MNKINLNSDRFLDNLQLQDGLSLGYLFLIILGLLDNVIYWSGLGINIFDYTSISDILLSPLNTFFYNLRGTFLIIFMLVCFFYLMKYLHPYFQKKASETAERKNKPYKEQSFQPKTIALAFFVLMFLGYNGGLSMAAKDRIQKKMHVANHRITFSDNTSKDVHVLGVNSVYLFYADIGSSLINIVPIADNIKLMQKLERNKN
jgi:hypothetical protein